MRKKTSQVVVGGDGFLQHCSLWSSVMAGGCWCISRDQVSRSDLMSQKAVFGKKDHSQH